MTLPGPSLQRAWPRAKAVVSWVRGLRDAIKALLLLLLTVSGLGFSMYVQDSSNEAIARSLLAHGRTTQAVKSRVYIGHHNTWGRSGGYVDIDQVSVTLPGVEKSVSLQITQAPYMEGVREGWQSPSLQTGYIAPFAVRYRVESDGSVTAAAEDDVEYWSGNTPDMVDPRIFLLVGFGGILGGALTVGGVFVGRTLMARRNSPIPRRAEESTRDDRATQFGHAAAGLTVSAAPPVTAPPSRASRHIGEPKKLTLGERWVQARTTPRRRLTDPKNNLSGPLFAAIMGPVCVGVGIHDLGEPRPWAAHAQYAGLALLGIAILAALIFYLLRPATVPPASRTSN